MIRRAVVLGSLGAAAVTAACGGRVDGGSSSYSPEPSPVVTAPRPPSGGRRPTPDTSVAAIAADIATTYCKAFSSCCVGAGQRPIDVARCREVTNATVLAKLDALGVGKSGSTVSATDVALCTDSIRARVAVCAKDDSKWWERGDAFFGPWSIQVACESVLGSGARSAERCSTALACNGGRTCAIDECVDDSPLGAPCDNGQRCFDGAVCNGSSCVAAPMAAAGEACTTAADCRLGLVCFASKCAPAREHPELYEPRSSPYRAGADTCSAFTFL